MFVDFAAQALEVNFNPVKQANGVLAATGDIKLFKPTTMMNNSGQAIGDLLRYFKLEPTSMVLTYDDLDIPLGQAKLTFDKGPKVHNGVNSTLQHVDSPFWHLRFGVDVRPRPIPNPSDFVLSNFRPLELDALQDLFVQVMRYLDDGSDLEPTSFRLSVDQN